MTIIPLDIINCIVVELSLQFLSNRNNVNPPQFNKMKIKVLLSTCKRFYLSMRIQ
jgi:hypothetical protein